MPEAGVSPPRTTPAGGGAARPRRLARKHVPVGATIARSSMSILVWLLFGVLVLGPLLTIFVISFVENAFVDDWKFTAAHYEELFSDPALYGPLLRSLEIALIVVVVQVILGSLIAFS